MRVSYLRQNAYHHQVIVPIIHSIQLSSRFHVLVLLVSHYDEPFFKKKILYSQSVGRSVFAGGMMVALALSVLMIDITSSFLSFPSHLLF
jgi:hypothetical protein